MKHLFAFLVALLFALPAFARPEHSVVRDYVQHVHLHLSVLVPQTPNGGPGVAELNFRGSVVVIAPNYAVSSWHVFRAAEHIPGLLKPKSDYLMSKDGNDENAIQVEVVKRDEEHDLVLLKGNFGCPCAPLARTEPELDEPVYAAGYPSFHVHGLQLLTTGTYQGVAQDGRYFFTANTAPGGSGGGAFQKLNGQYRLIGIIASIGFRPVGQDAIQEYNWMAFAVQATHIHALIKGTPAETKVR